MVKARSLTVEWPLILVCLSEVEAGGIHGGAVKCIDIMKNTKSESSLLDCH